VSSLLDVDPRDVRLRAPSRAALAQAATVAAGASVVVYADRVVEDALEFAGGDLSDDLAVVVIGRT
jgi:hypothetical protein